MTEFLVLKEVEVNKLSCVVGEQTGTGRASNQAEDRFQNRISGAQSSTARARFLRFGYRHAM